MKSEREEGGSYHEIIDDFVAPRCDELITILYEDDDILLIDKPSGLLSLSGKNPPNWDSVHYRLVHGQEGLSPAFPEAKLPHRLDFGTSGIMVVGLHEAASKHLNQQFQRRLVEKSYVAMLEGWLAADKGRICAPIARDRRCFPRVKICENTGKSAITEYTVIKRLDQPRRSLVKFCPQMGRTHQLRIHSESIGHPILGCDLYHSDQSAQMADRLLLHASDLYFQHPNQHQSAELFHGFSKCPFFDLTS